MDSVSELAPDNSDVTDWGAPSSRTITWHDPRITAAAASTMTGIELLRAVVDGRLPPPPIAATFGFTLHSIEVGKAEFRYTPDMSAYNPIGSVHGGLTCTLLDSAIACAVHSTLPQGLAYTSIEIKVSYLRAVRHDSGELRARGWVTKPGRRVAFGEGDLRTADGTVLATASSSCLVFPFADPAAARTGA
jgi:uncharacterized protein (TIGR00369 family)